MNLLVNFLKIRWYYFIFILAFAAIAQPQGPASTDAPEPPPPNNKFSGAVEVHVYKNVWPFAVSEARKQAHERYAAVSKHLAYFGAVTKITWEGEVIPSVDPYEGDTVSHYDGSQNKEFKIYAHYRIEYEYEYVFNIFPQ